MKQRTDYTFKYNQNLGRHGWLRLTPAYSVKLVEDILGTKTLFDTDKKLSGEILDPFCGTATTGIVAAENGLNCTLFEINPFLYWFASAKSVNYNAEEVSDIVGNVKKDLMSASFRMFTKSWIPQMKNIERWWSPATQIELGKLHQFLTTHYSTPSINPNVHNLLWIAFARLVIECSAADFGHISVSFKQCCSDYDSTQIINAFVSILDAIATSAKQPSSGKITIINGDARDISTEKKFNYVITSPPYPNRISYIRELRPYMYWLGFLSSGEEAGELDWKAIGGTWGSATSRLSSWQCSNWEIPESLNDAVKSINNADSKNGHTLSKYVLKFFYDMSLHFDNLRKSLADGCSLYYILGNSSFYGNMVNTDVIICEILNNLGYSNVKADIIRKRNSKKELFEFMINANWN